MKNSIGFTKFWKLLKQIDYFAGLFLLEQPEKPTWCEKFLSCSLVFAELNILILTISTIFLSDFSLISIILGASVGTAGTVICYVVWTLKRNKSKLNKFLDWCSNLYDVQTKFHPAVRDLASSHLEIVQKRALKIIKFAIVCFYAGSSGVTVGFAFVGIFLPENIYPKYSLPLPFVYPFSTHKTPLTFFVGLLGQMKLSMDFTPLILFLFAEFYCIIMHILTVLDIVKASIRLMKEKMTVKPQILSDILEEDVANKLSFDEWIKIITEMITDVNQVMSQLSEFLSEPLLLAEIGTLGSLFFSGMVFLVVQQQYVVAIAAFWFPVVYLLICIINEKILDKFSDISEELYDIPWYTKSVKEQKTLLIAMKCDLIQEGLNAGKFHALNNERFATVLNVAYSNCLVLRDLIKK